MHVTKPNHILVPVDGSETASHAAAYAAMLQREMGCRITMLYVYGLPADRIGSFTSEVRLIVEESKKSGFEVLEREIEKCSAQNVQISTLMMEGDVAQVIKNLMENQDFDLVVMGSKGIGSPLKRFFVGSVAKKVVTEVEKPVVIVRAPEEER